MSENETLWTPSPEVVEHSNLNNYRTWLRRKYEIGPFDSYEKLWAWSVENPETFWQTIWKYFNVEADGPYTSVLEGPIDNCQWFEGTSLNLVEHVFRNSTSDYPALLFRSERVVRQEISWQELEQQTACVRAYLDAAGVESGDRVAAFLPNIPEATVAFLAAASAGAVWSSCSPDFGADSVIDRFSQIGPRVLIAVDGYQYGGKAFDRLDVVNRLLDSIPTIEKVLLIPYLEQDSSLGEKADNWHEVIATPDPGQLTFRRVPFAHPLWVLYSSGTTGVPKAITHSHGGILLEHLKYPAFHNDVKKGERFFWFSTTGWMMWNYVHGALLHGATPVLYDGSPAYPGLNALWKMAEALGVHHFGTSAPYLVACMKKGISPAKAFDLSNLRSVSSTGAPLPPEAFDWCYEHVKKDLWLCSMSGGTDVCTAFVGGTLEKPVRRGEIQCRALGCDLHAFDSNGEPVIEELGEMVIATAMPSMPIYFWNDPDRQRLTDSYFDSFPGVWRHGDWVRLTSDGGLVIHGRSDATLNRQGVRIGTAEIYRALNSLDFVKDALIVHLDRGEADYMPLFVVSHSGQNLSEEEIKHIKSTLRTQCSPRHVPDTVYTVGDIPFTISGKKMEAPVKKVLSGADPEAVLNMDAMRNPEAMDFFIELATKIKI